MSVRCPKCQSSATHLSAVKSVGMGGNAGRMFSCRTCGKVAYDAAVDRILATQSEQDGVPTDTVPFTPAADVPRITPVPPPRPPVPPPHLSRPRRLLCRWPGCDRKVDRYDLCTRDLTRACRLVERRVVAASVSASDESFASIVALWDRRQEENAARVDASRRVVVTPEPEPAPEPIEEHPTMPFSSTDTAVPPTISTEVTEASSISEQELEARYKALVQSRKVAAEARELADAIEKMKEAHDLLVQEADGLRRTALGIVS